MKNSSSRFPKAHSFLVAAAAGLLACPASAQSDPQSPAPVPPRTPWYQAISVNGFVSSSYSYNFNRPEPPANQFRVFDFDDRTFKIDVGELVVQKPAAAPGEAGFRVDAVAGGSIPRVSAAAGLFQGQDFDLQQAFVSYVAPLGSGLRIDAGKFVTHMGYELIDGYDGYNDNATRSFLFGYAVPFTHTGLRASYQFSGQVAGMLALVNGWDAARDNNAKKSVGLQISWTPSSTASVTANYIGGPERTDENGDWRHDVELIVQWKATPATVFTLDAVWGSEQGAAAAGDGAQWWALAGFARIGLSERFALCLRGEYFDDPDGVRTGVSQKLWEITLTPELKLGKNAALRADLRFDFSSEEVFHEEASLSKRQPTLLINALTFF